MFDTWTYFWYSEPTELYMYLYVILDQNNISGLLVNRRGEEVEKAALNTDAITFDEFLSGEFSAKFFNGSWWSDTELQWKDQVSLSFKKI